MASFKKNSSHKTVWEILKSKARKKSLYEARIIFQKYDNNCLNQSDIRLHILKFDWKHGKWIELIWAKYSEEEYIIRIVRDRYNRLHLFDTNNLFQYTFIKVIVFFSEVKFFIKNFIKK